MEPAKSGRMGLIVDGVVALSVVFEAPDSLPKVFVVEGDHSSFATCRHDFVLAERP